MEKTNTVTAQSDKKNGHKPETAIVREQVHSSAPVTDLADELLGANGVQSLATHLSDARMQTAQRRQIAAQIGQRQGNDHLQRVLQRQTGEVAAPASLIVEDDAETLQPGQMRKSEFLAQLKEASCAAADEALSGSIYSTVGCPYITKVFGTLPGYPAEKIERMIGTYASEVTGATTAAGYIGPVTNRVRAGIARWLATGEPPSLPEGLSSLGNAGLPEQVSAAGSGLLGQAKSAISNLLFKARSGGANQIENPDVVRAELGPGHSLDGSVKSKMGSAFGYDFSSVRLHTDSNANQLSHDMNARAFTVGNDVAFGHGEYQPNTPIGDALIAHELAHVMQQGSSSQLSSPLKKGEEYGDLENDADVSAVRAVLSIWGGVKGTLAGVSQEAMPRLRSGLRLHRCKDNTTTSASSASSSHATLADQAVTLGGDTVTMDSYRNYQSKTWKWFFSPNTKLAGRAGKPPSFASWNDWDNFHWQSRQVIADLAGLSISSIQRTNAHLAQLQAAYNNWPASKFAVFQSGTSATNTCNVFLGDALFMDGKNQVTGGKYYSAADVYNSKGAFSSIDKKDVLRGDIVAWDFGHVEIVTSVDPLTGTFCSRGGYREPMGQDKCGGAERTISNTGIRFLRIK